jgi:hypothetical protein
MGLRVYLEINICGLKHLELHRVRLFCGGLLSQNNLLYKSLSLVLPGPRGKLGGNFAFSC